MANLAFEDKVLIIFNYFPVTTLVLPLVLIECLSSFETSILSNSSSPR